MTDLTNYIKLNSESILNELFNNEKSEEMKNEFIKWAKEEKIKLTSQNTKGRRSSSLNVLDDETGHFDQFSHTILEYFKENSQNINWQHIASDSKSINDIVINCEYGKQFTDIMNDTKGEDSKDDHKDHCDHNIEEVKGILKLLGILRHNVIDIIFDNLKNKHKLNNYFYTAFGSTNITSDFDLTICGGPQSNFLCWEMFKTYYGIYKNTLPQNFDSNLYVGAYDIYDESKYNDNIKDYIKDFNMGIIKNNKGEKNQTSLFTINIRQKEKKNVVEDLNWAYIWALVKVSESDLLGTSFEKFTGKLHSLYTLARSLKKNLTDNNISTIICKTNFLNSTKFNLSEKLKKFEEIFKREKNSDTNKVILNYYLQTYFQEIVNKKIYKNYTSKIKQDKKKSFDKKYKELTQKFSENNLSSIYTKNNIKSTYQLVLDTDNLIFLRGLNLFFSSEAYYTDMTVQAIVLEGQAGGELGLTNDHYLIAALENIGDFYKHSSHAANKTNDSFNVLIKFSKYIYRIYLCLSKVNTKYVTLRDGIKKTWVKLRETYNREEKCGNVKCFKEGLDLLALPELNIKFEDNEIKDILQKIKDKLLDAFIIEYKKIHRDPISGGYYNKYMKYKKKYLHLKNSQ
jgi:hypothetical protein